MAVVAEELLRLVVAVAPVVELTVELQAAARCLTYSELTRLDQ